MLHSLLKCSFRFIDVFVHLYGIQSQRRKTLDYLQNARTISHPKCRLRVYGLAVYSGVLLLRTFFRFFDDVFGLHLSKRIDPFDTIHMHHQYTHTQRYIFNENGESIHLFDYNTMIFQIEFSTNTKRAGGGNVDWALSAMPKQCNYLFAIMDPFRM